MFFKITAIATIRVVECEQDYIEQIKTIKLRVISGTTVREFIDKAFKKADLGSSYACMDVQYSSKKFGKFVDVGYKEKVKDGREYKIDAIKVDAGLAVENIAMHGIKNEEDKLDEEIAAIVKDVDLITCKSYDHVDVGSSTNCVTEQPVETEQKRPTYADVVANGEQQVAGKSEKEKQQDLEQVVLMQQSVVFEKSKEDKDDEKSLENLDSIVTPSTPLSAPKKSIWSFTPFSAKH